MKSGGDPPPAPDPTVSAQAQGQSNIQTAIANARLNRVNQSTPWGSINYTQGPVDANGVPSYSSEIKLDPQQQAQLDEQRRQQTQRQQIAAALLGQAGGALSKPLDLSGAHQVYDRYASQQPPKPVQQQQPQSAPQGQNMEQMLTALQAYLAQMGQTPGGGNPTARYADALRGNGSPSPSTVAASGAATPTPAAPSNIQSNGAFSMTGSLQGVPSNEDGSYTVGGTNQPNAAGQRLFGSVGSPQFRANSNDLVGTGDNGFANTHQGAYVNNPRVDPNTGFIDGGYAQTGRPPDQTQGTNIIDPSKIKYDPEFGWITPAQNFRDTGQDWLSQIMPVLVGLGFGGAAMGAAMGGGEGAAAAAGEGMGTGAFDVGGSAGFGGTVPLETGAAATTAGSTIPMGDMGAASATSGMPMGELGGATATQPSMGSQMMTNLQNGRGLLGMSGGQRAGAAALPALIQILRGGGQRRGG